MKLNNKAYDILKWIALIVLPALNFLYESLATIWGFPCGEQVTATIAAFNLFLGVVLGISNASYKKDGET